MDDRSRRARTPGAVLLSANAFFQRLAYVVAVCCLDRLAVSLGTATRLLVTLSFAFATVALPYARQVNNHILLLAIAAHY